MCSRRVDRRSAGSVGGQSAASITTRLVALFTVTSALLLGGVASMVYRGVALHLDEEHQLLLAEIVRVLQHTSAAQAERWTAAGPPAGGGADSDETHGAKYAYRTLSPSGRVHSESEGMGRVPPEAFLRVPVAAPGSATAGTPWRAPGGAQFLLAAAPLAGGDGAERHVSVQVALDVTHDTELLADLRARAAVVLLAGIVVSGLAGALVARHGLKPLKTLTAEIARVSAQQLQRRLDLRPFPTELHQLVEAFNEMLNGLDRAFADLSAYSANLAHELRTPLANLQGEAEVALLRERRAADYREVLASSLEELKRISRTIDALLFLARADRREAVMSRRSVSVAAESRLVLDFYTALAEDKGVTLHVVGDASADLDADLFRRALGNLIANALRHAVPGGTVTIDIRRPGDGSVEVLVVDDGAGIEAAELPHVFERFYRGGSSVPGDPGGSGLGLSIVKSIVELHGGQVSVSSVSGAGTEVTMRFPATTVAS